MLSPTNPWHALLTGENPNQDSPTDATPGVPATEDNKPEQKIVPTWIRRDIEQLRLKLAEPERNRASIDRLTTRIDAQFAGFVASRRRVRARTVEQMVKMEAEYTSLIGRPSRADVLRSVMERAYNQTPEGRRTRIIPSWAIHAVDVYRRCMERLARVERAAQAGDASARRRVARMRMRVVSARQRAEELIEHGAEHADGAARERFVHFRRVMRDALAGYAAVSGCSFANESFEELLDRHHGLLYSIVNQAKQRREYEDLEQQARTALLESAAKFRMDHEQQAKLTTVAVWNMKRACETRGSGAAKPGMYIHNNQEKYVGSLDVPLPNAEPGEETRVSILEGPREDIDTTLTVRDALSKLESQERLVAEAIFMRQECLEEAAESTGLSLAQVRRFRDSAHDKLARLLVGVVSG